eukprot:jgi/Chrzof1/3160/Cz12g14030.t1
MHNYMSTRHICASTWVPSKHAGDSAAAQRSAAAPPPGAPAAHKRQDKHPTKHKKKVKHSAQSGFDFKLTSMSGPPAATGYMQQDGTAAVTPAATGVGDPQRPASLGPIQKSRRLWQKGQFLDWLAATTQGVGRKAQKHILVVGVFAFVPAAYAALFLSNRYSMVGSAKQLLSSANPEHHVQAVSQLRWAIWPLWASGSAIRRLVEAGVHEQLLGLIQADVSHGKASLISTV